MQTRYITQTLKASSATAICASQTPATAGNILINGGLATSGVATLDTARQVLFTFTGNESGHSFIVYGTSGSGQLQQESLAGQNGGTLATVNNFKTVTNISISAAATAAITVGTNGVGASDWQIVNAEISPIHIALSVLVTGTVNYTVQYTMEDPSGTYPNPKTPATTGYQVTPSGPLIKFPNAFNDPVLVGLTTSADSVITTPVSAIRLLTNSGTGTAQLIFIQAGIDG